MTKRKRTPSTGDRAMDRELFSEKFEAILDNVEKVIKGKRDVLKMVLTAILANGHVLLEDLPGTGKTMTARSFAQTIDVPWNRIQCTPDLLPSDVTGSPILEMATQKFIFRQGPVFANILLVDEVNRATPKTQSALLEAMQERNVTVDGITYPLPNPFLMIATQNPIELAGTFPLPEAQVDRFLFKLSVGYPSPEAEAELMLANSESEAVTRLTGTSNAEEVLAMQAWSKGVALADGVIRYIIDICQATRKDPSLMIGASPRASQGLMRAGRVFAAAQGREDVIPDDIKTILVPAVGHRLILTPDAQLREETVENVLDRIVTRVKAPLSISQGAPRSDKDLATAAAAV
jgi:MoxR-like ATPase